MKLSIIVPMYNTEKYIEKCLISLLNQDLSKEDYEILVINDGSKDNSLKIVNEYERKYNNIKVINIRNSGVSKARNIGINHAGGDYLFFVDSDDYVAENTIKSVIDIAIEEKLDMLFFDVKETKSESAKKSSYSSKLISPIVDGRKYFSKNNVRNGPWHYFVNREFIFQHKIKFVENRCWEDCMFLIDCLFIAKKVSKNNTDIYRYVIRPNSLRTSKDKLHNLNIINDFKHIIIFLNEYCILSKKIYGENELFLSLLERKNSYIFFMQIRMIKNKIGYKKSKDIIDELIQMKCYKYSRLSKRNYPGLRYSIIHRILNNKIVFSLLCI